MDYLALCVWMCCRATRTLRMGAYSAPAVRSSPLALTSWTWEKRRTKNRRRRSKRRSSLEEDNGSNTERKDQATHANDPSWEPSVP